MFETAGSLTIVQSALALLGLVLLPLVWTVVAGVFAQRTNVGHGPRVGRANDDLIASIVAISCAFATLGLSLVLATRLALLPRGHLYLQHLAQLARLGQLDLAFDITLDARSAAFAVLIAVIACASALQTSSSSLPGRVRRLAWSGLITSGAMFLCVGDGLAPLLVGLGLLSLGAWGLSLGAEPGSSVVALAGNVSAFLGLVFLFWSLGGTFGPEGYDPDGAPRFVLVATSAPSEPPDKATLTMTTHAGALVSSDDADLPGEPIAAPFSILVPPGVYTLRVQGGVASGDVVVRRVALTPGRTHALAAYGPTASLRVLDDQIMVPRLGPNGGFASVRAVLAARTVGGLRASAIVLLLVFAGMLAHVHALASRRGPSGLASVLEAMPAPYLALRLAPLVEPTGADGALVALLGAGSAALLAARASSVDDAHQALRGVLGAVASVALAAAGLGEPSAALVLAISALLATSAALAAIEARRDVRWLGVACAAAVGLLPGAGASSGYILAITAALGAALTGSAAWAVFVSTIASAMVITCAFGALAAFRVYDAIIQTSARTPGKSRAQGAIVVVLSVLSVAAGIVLGAGTTMFGGVSVPLARRLVGPGLAPTAPRAMAFTAVGLSLAAAAVGIILARRVGVGSRPPPWLLALGRPYAMVERAAASVASGMRALAHSAKVMDRDVIDDLPAALRDVAMKAGGRVVLTKLAPNDPRTASRLCTLLVIAMVVLLGLVVLSSLVLG